VVSNDDEEVIERRRFMAACWGDGQPATALVMLDPAGNLTDLLYSGSFSGPLRRPPQGYDLFMDPKTVRCPVVRTLIGVPLEKLFLWRSCVCSSSILIDHLSWSALPQGQCICFTEDHCALTQL
jgi:hypothetical protein